MNLKGAFSIEYGIRKVGDDFMIGDSLVGVDRDGNIHIKKVELPTTKGSVGAPDA